MSIINSDPFYSLDGVSWPISSGSIIHILDEIQSKTKLLYLHP